MLQCSKNFALARKWVILELDKSRVHIVITRETTEIPRKTVYNVHASTWRYEGYEIIKNFYQSWWSQERNKINKIGKWIGIYLVRC